MPSPSPGVASDKIPSSGLLANGRRPRLLKSILPELLEAVRTLARYVIRHPRYKENLAARVFLGRAPHVETLLWHYAHGKPVERVQHVEGSPLDFAAMLQEAWGKLKGFDPRQPRALPLRAIPQNGAVSTALFPIPEKEDDNDEAWPGDLPASPMT